MEETLLAPESGGGRDGKGWVSRFGWGDGGRELMDEAQRLGYVAAPMVAVTMSQFLVQVISSMMVGHLGKLDLASAAIATSLTSVTGFSLLLGMASGLETLCGQAYGAEQYHMPLMKFLLSQSLILPMLLSSLATLCLHIPLCWVLVFKSGLRNVGAALSISISYWLNVFMLGMYIRYSASCRSTRAPISKEAFRGINEFLQLALPSALMTCLEWWSFELLILLSGLLPNPQLETSVLSICLNSISLLYCFPYGLGCATSTRVSNELGAWNPKGAQLVVRVAMFLAISEAIIVSGTLLAMRRILGYAYSNEEEVMNYVTEMVPLVCFSVVFDSLQGVLSGIARGCGWQHLGAYVNLGSFYLFGIPIAVVLGFLLRIGGKGLWIGIVCGSSTQTILLALITSFTNWQNQATMARERIFKERLPLQNVLK
ncbi:hypothetical protein OPV22_014480 [Ensete ventricosum]|uniref:Protein DETOXIFICATION n=1 Tax=Ensete ventricosum TaxID=4639 RepID=A0AAV8PJW3_ENSVE|nr:hypothetical protein OPV22_014480 [Ensete ventricosum]